MKNKHVNVALCIASVVFSFVFLEVGLQAWALLKGDSFIFDNELGWTPKQPPIARRLAPTAFRPVIRGRGRATVTILNDGIRSNGNGDIPNTTAPILAVGDSFTFGEWMSDWETWPAQLEKLSGQRVINGGVGAYGVDQTFLRAQRLLSRYRFSTVIFSFIAGDIERCQYSVRWQQPKPYFDFKDGRLTLENVPVPTPGRQASRLQTILEHSRLVNLVMERTFQKWWESRRGPSEVQVMDEDKGVQVACAVLRELERVTRSNGSELIILVQRVEHEDDLFPTWSIAIKRALSCLLDPDTRVLDLWSALSELKAMDPSKYHRLYFSDGHMTAEGNQFVATEIANFLTQRSMQVDQAAVSPARPNE